jgi:ADP-heptose:LPS heptosyltransferase
MQAKDWGQENWRDLVRRIAASYPGYGLVVIGAKEESAVGEYVLRDWNGPKLNLCGRLTPRQSAAVLEYASLFLGPDSGPMHLAACAGVPCVIAFSARGLPGVWYPAGHQHQILYRQVSCFGCNLESCVVEARRCLTSITVGEMAAAVDSVLSPRITKIPKPAKAGLQH